MVQIMHNRLCMFMYTGGSKETTLISPDRYFGSCTRAIAKHIYPRLMNNVFTAAANTFRLRRFLLAV